MSEYTPDTTERFPDAGEPAEEKEYVINAWIPMQIEVRAYGSSKEEAVKRAKEDLTYTSAKRNTCDYDKSEWELSEIEEV